MNIIFLQPYFKKTPWANDNLKKMFDLDQDYGEAWLISSIQGFESKVLNTNYNLREFILNNPKFFNLKNEDASSFVYPNLTKLLDSKTPLSIQVHPDNEYAKQFNSLGKNECWYVLKNSDQPFILGSKTNDINDFKKVMNTKEVENYLNKIHLENNDFVYINAGMIHGIPGNTMVFELQQSSDITYRIYDYERLDINGKKRDIHIKESLDTIKCNLKPEIQKQTDNNNFYKTNYFKLQKHELKNNSIKISTDLAKHCVELVVLSGNGFINDTPIKSGDVLLISKNQEEFILNGTLDLFLSYV
ncbi:type I phosphomannose isomerase catalytic subunit [Mycoplasma leonicaptivi]|uniref:type I phosphomannose isomerase catalytic subunit n=1 Tax=Mycoplasma leonicaptivi TaxID=36742 RepID=UPI0004849397|nr:type I phosphomannose isomerase catalytic subunit [Mycoplasma leonicaptivi]